MMTAAAPSLPPLGDCSSLLEGKTNLRSFAPVSVYCYQLDSSHPNVAAAYGDCELYYASSPTYPGLVRFCRWVDGGSAAAKCQRDDASAVYCLSMPPAVPRPLPPPAPLQPPNPPMPPPPPIPVFISTPLD